MSYLNGKSYEPPTLSYMEEEAILQFMTDTGAPWMTALKFLSAEEFKVAAAATRWKKCKDFLKSEGISDIPEPTASLMHYLTVPLFYLPSTCDRRGATLLIFNARYWVADEAGTRRMLKLLHYMCDKAASAERTRRCGITLISNLDGLDRRYQAVEVHRWIMEKLEYYLPVTLQQVLICKAPWWARVLPYAWRPGVCDCGPLSAQMHVCSDLLLYIEPSQLPRELGGELVYKHKEWITDQLRVEQCGNEDVLVEVDLGAMEARVFGSNSPSPSDSSQSSTSRAKYKGIHLGSPVPTPRCPENGDGYFPDMCASPTSIEVDMIDIDEIPLESSPLPSDDLRFHGKADGGEISTEAAPRIQGDVLPQTLPVKSLATPQHHVPLVLADCSPVFHIVPIAPAVEIHAK
ncbi:hypothetical protein SpCBS45565_g04740 [Spizellomyces sp. 'palustris']|nr:hypothetical protein SpCBS45565_g04740 [Spizellomyces sp. 'palustris']